ncbi:hypothetical protein E1B28_010430 [Marasmius oreades]|uniref:histidine kinase n=1 Tax=Marasmius oreades TaxID=181124 RepID=A0A9P7RXA6_9AGAR|nr:uncharacterized protein E1B28_010430 [Marasmius oreades]KAG7091392.1 hypothetical protein E1B28_010430 [Marasmius oreades]
MLFTSASLPLHHDREHSSLSRRVGFEQEDPSVWTKIRESIGKLAYIAIHAPTGSPSDGLGGDGTESTTSTSAFIAAQKQISAEKDGEDWRVDEVVVTGEDVDRWKRLGSEKDTTTGGTPGQSDSGSIRNNRTRNSPSSQGGNVYQPPSLRTKAKHIWSFVENFFNPTFEDEHAEADFKKQNWYSTKAIAFYASLYLVLNWVLYLALNKESTERTVYAQCFYYGGLTLLTVPLPFLIAADVPLRYPVQFQVWFTFAVWWCGVTELIQMKLCDFFGGAPNTCFRKDFLAMMYYITAVPAMMMFVIPHRLPSFIMMVAVLILISTCIMPEEGLFARNLISYILFSTFLQVLHYNKDITERRLYLLNNQLKVAYKAQQKAQMAQSRASQAKRRFASYIFHEVRVPLNNAAIAFHNLTTNNAFSDRVFKPHAEDVIALEVSLATVQQVLNDSLDLEKMDAGHFDINPHPFPLHSVIRSTLAPLIVSAAAKKLDLRISLDERIDKLAYRMNVEENGHKDWHGEKDSNRQSRSLDSPLPSYSTPPSPNSNRSRPFEATDYAGGVQKMERTRSSSSMHSPKARPANFKYPRPEPYISSGQNFLAGSDSRGAGELWVVGDEVRLRQVLTNLVSNAVKFTPDGAGDGITFSTSLVASVPASMSNDANDGNLDMPEEKEISVSREGRASREGREKDGKSGLSQDILVLRMEIVDSGPGIKPSELVDNQLFQPFAQTRVGKLSKNSTGLGLAIVRQIVSLSGGKLGVQSQRGRGATFWVELSYPIARMQDVEEGLKSCPSPSSFPRAITADNTYHWPTGTFSEDLKNPMLAGGTEIPLQPPPAFTPLTEISETTVVNPYDAVKSCPPEQLTASATITPQNGIDIHDSPLGTESNERLLVLVVDDDAITRKMMSRWLSLRGCVVHTAKDGMECLEILLSPEAPNYDFVSLDNFMPGMTGEEAVKEIRNAGRDDIFVVGCTGNALTDDQKSYLAAGANRVLTKPIDFKMMEQILQSARRRRVERNGNSDIY